MRQIKLGCSENFGAFMALLSSPSLGDYETILILNAPVLRKQVAIPLLFKRVTHA